MMLSSRWLLIVASLASCVDGARPFVRAAAPTARAQQVMEGRAELRLPTPGGAAIDAADRDAAGRAWVASEGGGVMRVVIDRLRIELRDGRVEAAEELTSERIEGAAEVGGAWLFVGREGAMHTSASFTGPLRPLRASDDVLGDAEMLRVVPSLGAASVVDEDGRAWRWDGRRLRALPFGDVVGAVWRGEEGVAIVRYDAVRVSRDGGATWREVAVPAGVPLRVGGHATGLYVDTSEARYRVRGDALVEAARYPQERPADVDLWPSHRPLTFNEERRVAPWIRALRSRIDGGLPGGAPVREAALADERGAPRGGRRTECPRPARTVRRACEGRGHRRSRRRGAATSRERDGVLVAGARRARALPRQHAGPLPRRRHVR